MHRPRNPERSRQPERLRHAVQPHPAVVLKVLARIQHIESANPKQHRTRQHHNPPIQRSPHRNPRCRRRNSQRQPQHHVRPPRHPLRVAVEPAPLPAPAEPAPASAGSASPHPAQTPSPTPATNPPTNPLLSVPAGRARIAVRGFAASSRASTSRLNAIAADRAATMQTTIQPSTRSVGQPPAASTAPVNANGSANTECSHLIISSVTTVLLHNDVISLS